LSVLLSSRIAWVISLVVAAACVAQLGRTYIHTKHLLDKGIVQVKQTEEAYQELRRRHVGANQDEKAIERLDPDGKIRAAIKARRSAAQETKLDKQNERSEASPGESPAKSAQKLYRVRI